MPTHASTIRLFSSTPWASLPCRRAVTTTAPDAHVPQAMLRYDRDIETVTIAHSLPPMQALVGMITITLFLPCFASLIMTVILADEVELALEHAVAWYIWVEKEAGEA